MSKKWKATEAFLDPEKGHDVELVYTYWTATQSQSHPFGSTSATETWEELCDGSEEFTLDGEPITREQLEERFLHIDWDAKLELMADSATVVDTFDKRHDRPHPED